MKTTQQAFEELLNSPNAAEKMGIKQEQIYILRQRLKTGKVSLNKMEKHLTQAGYQVAQEKMWTTKEALLFSIEKYFQENPEANKHRVIIERALNKPSFAPGGIITNSSAVVEIPKEYLKEKNMDAHKPIAKQQP